MKTIKLGLIAAGVLGAALVGKAIWPSGSANLPSVTEVSVAAPPPLVNTSKHLGEVGDVTIYKPQGAVKGVVLFLSGDGGWNLGVVSMAKALTAKGVAVAGFSTPAFLKALEANRDKCINPNFALSALAQDVEHQLGMPGYIKPILAGYSSGATIVYAALVQAPVGTYRGAVSLGFGPDINGVKPWCAAGGLSARPITKPEKGWLFGAVPQLSAPWLVMQGLDDQVVSPEVTRTFTSGIRQAQLIELPKVGHGFSVQSRWLPQFTAAFTPMLEAPRIGSVSVPGGGPDSLNDLPINVVTNAKAPRTDLMAVMYSGDGGWAGLDRDVAARLAAAGVPVVGVDSLQYFWNAKTPAGAGQDLARILSRFGEAWQRPRAIVLGYSFGADTLPFIVNALPPQSRSALVRASMLGLDDRADFQFHLQSWLNVSSVQSMPTIPEILRTRGLPLQCIRGLEESDSACTAIPAGAVAQVSLPGGHHFNGDANAVATAVLGGIRL